MKSREAIWQRWILVFFAVHVSRASGAIGDFLALLKWIGLLIRYIDRLRVGWLNGSSFIISRGRGTTSAEDAPGTHAQSYISPSVLVDEA